MLGDAFNQLLNMKRVPATLTRDADVINIHVSHSNYSRSMAGPSNIEIEGEEFIISAGDMVAPITEPKRGDRLLVDGTEFHSIKHVNTMHGLKGEILGWRVRSG